MLCAASPFLLHPELIQRVADGVVVQVVVALSADLDVIPALEIVRAPIILLSDRLLLRL
jgi:hypothetical protein